MKKSTIIATCLLNSKMITRLEDGENAVHRFFKEDYPKSNYNAWNAEIHEDTAKHIINAVGVAMHINVKKFIKDLSKSKFPRTPKAE